MLVHANIDTTDPVRALREVEARLPDTTKAAVVKVAGRVVEPRARADAAKHVGRFASAVTVKEGRNGAYLTGGTGLPGRVIGLAEFGGTVRTPIRPKRRAAVRTPQGPRAAVLGPRTYRAREFLVGAVEATDEQTRREVLSEILLDFERAGLETP
ncbi:hypothetical protein [Paraconexibacter algicola]|uniref:Uncharacterized protein n=1 Tax=Paraconexibacter algicola TaxID=2133960 RepID=A0A2T4UEA7_9ACTN|nr:hypothetical protein [Paraconexibacter algicola]PTL55752.1 hypothetical protein C7Y72_19170 [Paraconexibacter algicola]